MSPTLTRLRLAVAFALAGLCGCLAGAANGCGNTMGSTGTPATATGTATAGSATGATATGTGGSVAMTAAAGDLTVPAGFDVAALGPHERECFIKTVNDLLSPCGQPMTVAACVNAKADCALCGRVARLAYRDCAEGLPPPIVQECAVNSILSLQAEPVKIDVTGAPTKGALGAPIQIVEFSDFECPHCRDMAPILAKIMTEFDGKAVFHFKHFPLSFHEYAPNAAAAAIAAGLQGKFWEFHDKMFGNQSALQPENLKKYAADLGLDTAKFNQCLDSAKYEARVQGALAVGGQLGISSTPTVFVNGRLINGAQPIEVFQSVIDDELARGGK